MSFYIHNQKISTSGKHKSHTFAKYWRPKKWFGCSWGHWKHTNLYPSISWRQVGSTYPAFLRYWGIPCWARVSCNGWHLFWRSTVCFCYYKEKSSIPCVFKYLAKKSSSHTATTSAKSEQALCTGDLSELCWLNLLLSTFSKQKRQHKSQYKCVTFIPKPRINMLRAPTCFQWKETKKKTRAWSTI